MSQKRNPQPMAIDDAIDAPRGAVKKKSAPKPAPRTESSPILALVNAAPPESTTDKYRIGTKGAGYTRADQKVMVKFTGTVQQATDERYQAAVRRLARHVRRSDFLDALLQTALSIHEEDERKKQP